jgi:hypothetical protein
MFSRKILQGSLFIFIILCLLTLIFLLYLNKDIKVDSTLVGNNLKLDIKNTQSHINYIEVINNGTVVESYSIKPNENKESTIKLSKGKNLLEIKSNYNVIYSKEVEIKDSDNTSSLNFNVSYKDLKLKESTELVLLVCNPESPTSLTVEIYENNKFSFGTKEKTKQIEMGGCSEFPFIITPLEKGTHKTIFHIYNESNNINEEISFDLKVS